MNRNAPERGQALVEFALVLPVLLLLVVGIAEFGRLANHMLVLRHGSYDLVRAAAVNTDDAGILARGMQHAGAAVPNAGAYSDWYETDPETGKRTYVVRYSDDGDGQWAEMRLTPAHGERVQGDIVTVRFQWRFQPIFFGFVIPDAATFTFRATGRAEYPAR
jgi:hypothetical protein